MNDDALFRLVLFIGFAAVVPFAVYFRFKSMATREKLDRRQEGWFILIGLRAAGIVGMAGIVVFLIEPRWMSWSSIPLPAWPRWLGMILGIPAAGLLLWTFYSLGKNLTDTVVTRKDHSLVTNGAYRWVRHPFYLSFALALLANTLATANWFIFGAGVIAFGLIVARTRIEEQKLIERFGDDYRNYMKRTGRFFRSSFVDSGITIPA